MIVNKSEYENINEIIIDEPINDITTLNLNDKSNQKLSKSNIYLDINEYILDINNYEFDDD